MAIYSFARTQIVEMPLERCWAFFSDPRNLAQITPPALRFRVHSQTPGEIHPGLMLRYTVSPLLHLPMTWLTEITQVRRPHYFVDEQRVGPYRLWHHEHSFRALREDAPEVHDLVHYVPPFSPLGGVINWLAIERQLRRIFDFPRAATDRNLSGNSRRFEGLTSPGKPLYLKRPAGKLQETPWNSKTSKPSST